MGGQDGEQLALLKEHGVEVRMRGQVQEAAVGRAFQQPALHGVRVPVKQFIAEVWAVALEFTQDVRQPVCRGGRGRGNPHGAGFQPAQPCGFHFQRLTGCAELLRMGEQYLAVCGQAHPSTAAFHQRKPPLGFQVMDHAADTRL